MASPVFERLVGAGSHQPKPEPDAENHVALGTAP
jgi:hypothetical protein